jgi:peptidoglycan/LPS O-acetylase OafA/YrhL
MLVSLLMTPEARGGWTWVLLGGGVALTAVLGGLLVRRVHRVRDDPSKHRLGLLTDAMVGSDSVLLAFAIAVPISLETELPRALLTFIAALFVGLLVAAAGWTRRRPWRLVAILAALHSVVALVSDDSESKMSWVLTAVGIALAALVLWISPRDGR